MVGFQERNDIKTTIFEGRIPGTPYIAGGGGGGPV